MKSLAIKTYEDGFGYHGIDCISEPIAIGAGYYNQDNYYYYCFLHSIFANWIPEVSHIERRNLILNKLGLKLTPIFVDNSKDLIAKTKLSIDNDCPVLIPLDYYYMFYAEYYNKTHGTHGVLATEYDTDRAVIVIRETSHIHEETPFYRFQLTEELLSNIWVKSNEHLNQNNLAHGNEIYSIEKSCEPEINSYEQIIQELLNGQYIKNNNSLLSEIENFDSVIEGFGKLDIHPYAFRSRYTESVDMFFKLIDKFIIALDLEDSSYNELYLFRNDYLKYRREVISVLTKYAFRGKSLDANKKSEIIEKIRKYDNELHLKILNFYEQFKNQTNYPEKNVTKNLKNYAANCSCTASSEYQEVETNILSASRAVDGKYSEQKSDMWASDELICDHWLKVDLGAQVCVSKFIIRHDFTSRLYYLVDYKIQGSNDDANWDDIVVTEDNNKDITINEITPSSYRYLRIYITKPSRVDSVARIMEFEILGE
ncbi:MAG: discoidin domain-containing protein [Lutisporaceae bacterium]